MGEMGRWFVNHLGLDVEYDVVTLEGWQPDAAPGYGWPLNERNWVNPEPERAQSMWMARCYAWNRDARRHDAFRGTGYYSTAGVLRRPGYRCPRADRNHARDGASVVRGLPPA